MKLTRLVHRVVPSWSALACRVSLLGALAACGPTDEAPSAEARSQKTASAALTVPLQVSAETATNPQLPSGEATMASAVAAGNGIYLLVWMETAAGGSDPNIMGLRIRESDGARLDTTPIPIATTSAIDLRPAVAFDGTNFLVVWESDWSGTVRGRRIRASDGALLEPSSQIYSPAPYYLMQESPSLAFDGTNFVLTWIASIWDAQGFRRSVHGLRIRPSDGAALDAAPFPIGTDQAFPQVASAGGTSLVVWAGSDGSARAARIDSAGQVLDTSPLLLGSTEVFSSPRVAARGDRFLVLWSSGSALKARSVRASDGALLGDERLLDNTLINTGGKDFAVFLDGSDYRVVWKGTREGAPRLLAMTVTPDGLGVGDSEQRLSDLQLSGSDSYAWVNAAPMGAKRYLTTYAHHTSSSTLAYYRLVNPFSCSPDVTPPVLRCPATLTVECTYSGQRTLGNFEYGDNCGLNYVSTIPEYIGSPGTSTHYVYATDTSNNTTYCHTVWTVRDTRAPTVYLSGSANMTLTQGTPYQEPGYWGEDGCEGYGPWISSRIQVLGAVNSSQPGSYQLEYRLTDDSGNTGKAFRQVNVVAP
ncbi:DUF5011 domain-containing protein [Archangium violaceum]|uniref:DUF5011 domain-containing protein n=1 Tax=Archangium violaceum TaxID=83451 RepID=UPI0036D9606D